MIGGECFLFQLYYFMFSKHEISSRDSSVFDVVKAVLAFVSKKFSVSL